MTTKFLFSLGILLTFHLSLYGETDQAKELGKFLGQHGYGAMRVEAGDNNHQIFEQEINGKGVTLEIDTGCESTCLSSDCARRLKLTVRDAGYQNWGVGGTIKGNMGRALIASWKLNNYEINRTNIVEVLPPGSHPGHNEGLFGLDYLYLNAAILPVGARFFLYKPGNGAVPAIESYMIAMGFKSLPLHLGKGGLEIKGKMNGQPFTAVVDCGAAYSIFDLDYITKVRGGQVSSDRMTMEGVDGKQEDCYVYYPKDLTLGPLLMKNTETTACHASIFKLSECNALFGYDLLAAHQAIIDLGHNVLWMK